MHVFHALFAVILTVLIAAPSAAAQASVPAASTANNCPAPRKLAPEETWRDPSPHRCGYVTVNGVRLHYLDWGGSGETVIFLHGLGTTAHVFDDLAPQLTDRFRVLALTRRGHAESAHPESGYTIPQTTADLLAFLDALDIRKAHLIAHSLGGAEATRLAVEHPERVHRVIYLDGLPDWTGIDSILGHNEPERPAPGDAFRTIATHREWLHHMFYGFWTPALEADFRYSGPNPKANGALRQDAFARAPVYNRLSAPALALVAVQSIATDFPWLSDSSSNLAARRRAQDYLDQVLNPYLLTRAERFRREAPKGKVLVFEGSHYIHNSNPEVVLSAIRAFLLADN